MKPRIGEKRSYRRTTDGRPYEKTANWNEAFLPRDDEDIVPNGFIKRPYSHSDHAYPYRLFKKMPACR